MDQPQPLEPTTVIVQSGESISTEIDGESVMMNLETNSYYGVDEIGSRIWALVEQPITIDALCSQLQEEFQVDPQTCQRDVVALLQELVEERLVTVQA